MKAPKTTGFERGAKVETDANAAPSNTPERTALPGSMTIVNSIYDERVAQAQAALATAQERLAQLHEDNRAEINATAALEQKLASEKALLGQAQTEFGEAILAGKGTDAIQQRIITHQVSIGALEALLTRQVQKIKEFEPQILRFGHNVIECGDALDNAVFWQRAAKFARDIAPFEADRQWLAENARRWHVNTQFPGTCIYGGASRIGHLIVDPSGELLARQF